MAYRQFTDAEGAEWTAYDVVPRAEERRTHDRRGSANSDDLAEDRRLDDRRAGVSTSRPVRLTRGWLCFESSRERRRLQPIPENWHHRTDAELVSLLQQARVAPRKVNTDQEAGTGRP